MIFEFPMGDYLMGVITRWAHPNTPVGLQRGCSAVFPRIDGYDEVYLVLAPTG
jgi:hypothetical protein